MADGCERAAAAAAPGRLLPLHPAGSYGFSFMPSCFSCQVSHSSTWTSAEIQGTSLDCIARCALIGRAHPNFSRQGLPAELSEHIFAQAPAWAPGWKPALNLRFSSSQRHPAAGALPQKRQKPGRQPRTGAEPQSQTVNLLSSGSRQTSRMLLGPLAMQISAARRHRRHRRQEHTRQQAAQHADSNPSKAPAHDPAAAVQAQPHWRAERLQPFRVLPLWEGGIFDERYNLRRSSINFTAPAGSRRVLLEAVITGAASNQECTCLGWHTLHQDCRCVLHAFPPAAPQQDGDAHVLHSQATAMISSTCSARSSV